MLLIILVSLCLTSCNLFSPEPPSGENLRLRAVSFRALPGWSADSHLRALEAFLQSCQAINRRAARDWFGPNESLGRVSEWQEACGNAGVVERSEFAAKEFFEANFRPHEVSGTGTFTGYYEVEVSGSRARTGAYQFPIYAKPNDLGSRSPYYSRAQIDGGALAGRNLELMYLASAADAFLLHVQGSGSIALSDGTRTRVGYAGNNGYGFNSIFDALKGAGYDPAQEGASMVDFRRWLNENPTQAERIIQANPRFIFFAESDGSAAVGAQGVPLTAGRSLAVDDAYLAYGVPIYLDTAFVDPARNNARRELERLVVAQDTGTAITGQVRGDFFWGTGEQALQYAGRMKEEGRYFLLLPR